MGKVLVIVDVQKEFDEYIQHDLVDALSAYAEKFDTVYQIWDTHNNTVAPTHSFPGQVDSVPKKYGKKHFSDDVKNYIKKIEDSSEEGRTFKLDNDEGYIVRVKNNHDWFYVNPEIVDLISKLKGNKVILAGGADGECLEDVYQTFLAFGLKTHINKKYTYSAKTTEEDSVEEVIESKKIPAFLSKQLILENDNIKNYEYERFIFKVDSESDVTRVIDYVQKLFPEKEITSSAFHTEIRNDMSYPNWLFADKYVLCDTRDYNHTIILNILANYPDNNTLTDLIDKSIERGNDKKYDPNVFTVDNLGEFGALVKTGIRRFTPKPSYMLSKEERKRRFITESKNDKEKSHEIVIRLENEEEREKLDRITTKIDNSFQTQFVDEYPCVVYLNFRSQNDCWGNLDTEDCKAAFKGDWDNEDLDGVYHKLYTIKDIKIIEKILKEKQIIDNIMPSYMLSKEERNKRFIRESNNDEETAREIVIKIETEEEYEKLKDELSKIDHIYSDFLTGFLRSVEPYYIFILFNLDNKDSSPHDIVSWYDGSDSETEDMENGIFDGIGLNNVYGKLFTFDDLDEVLRIIRNKSIHKNIPNYMLSKEERKKRFIRESKNS